jgi:hypothetical protein
MVGGEPSDSGHFRFAATLLKHLRGGHRACIRPEEHPQLVRRYALAGATHGGARCAACHADQSECRHEALHHRRALDCADEGAHTQKGRRREPSLSG